MVTQSGWLPQVRQLPSPNHNARPVGADVSVVVIHTISLPPGDYGGGYIDQLFTNSLESEDHPYFETLAGLQVSAHLLIDRQGQVTQFVSLEERAWHAGQSRFGDATDCNDFSIGIELEGTDIEPYTDQQYQSLVQQVVTIMQQYPKITAERIVGHVDIAPGRKTDPGDSFDWHRFHSMLNQCIDQEALK